MLPIATIGDIGEGVCYAGHPDVPKDKPKDMTTTLITGDATVFVNNLPVATLGSIGETDCGHTTTAISASTTVYVGFLPVHRLGDTGVVNEDGEQGSYEMITGSGNVFVG